MSKKPLKAAEERKATEAVGAEAVKAAKAELDAEAREAAEVEEKAKAEAAKVEEESKQPQFAKVLDGEVLVILNPPKGTGPGCCVSLGGDKPRSYQVDADGRLRVLPVHIYTLQRMHGFTLAPGPDPSTERLEK
ncbi:hypothetical protein N9X87_00550 [bacterium]|nr:hypothetical protein [bacterium]